MYAIVVSMPIMCSFVGLGFVYFKSLYFFDVYCEQRLAHPRPRVPAAVSTPPPSFGSEPYIS